MEQEAVEEVKEKEKAKSRKLSLLYAIIGISTFATFIPPIVVWIFLVCGKTVPPLSLLGSTEWVSLISLILSTYFGATVYEKKIAMDNGIAVQDLDQCVMNTKAGLPMKQNNVQITIDQGGNDSQDNVDPIKEALRDKLRHGE
jgi:hypothetical protein